MASNVVCLVFGEPERVTVTWSEGPASFRPYHLNGNALAKFRDLAKEARVRLSDVVKEYLFLARDGGSDADLRAACLGLATTGHKLYKQLFLPGADERELAEKVRQWLEGMRDHDAVGSLEFVSDGVDPVPWNAVYDEKPDEAAFLSGDDPARWRPFWGVRYNLAGGRRVEPLRRLPWLDRGTLRLVLAVCPKIRAGLPEDLTPRLDAFVRARSAEIDLTVTGSKAGLEEALAERRPDLLYFLCHATPDALVLGDDEISPSELSELLQGAGGGFGGLAFLNACQTAEQGQLGSFLGALHEEGFSGIVATEHQTIDTFAHPFGLDFLDAFLDTGESIGTLLQRLRGGRTPLGLLYGTYCPPGIYVRRGGAGASRIEVAEAPLRAGVALGGGASASPVVCPLRTGPLPAEPYRSLAYFEHADRALFTGRDDDVRRFAVLLCDPRTRVMVLHGESGVGKSSFLRAGVIPYLEEECVGYRFLKGGDGGRGAPMFVRATNDPIGQVARALAEFGEGRVEVTTPLNESAPVELSAVLSGVLGEPATAEGLRARLPREPELLGRLMAALGGRLPFAPILVIDQAEEVFTLARRPEDAENRRLVFESLREAARTPGDFKIVLSLRTEYYGRLVDGLRRGRADLRGVREYLLNDFDTPELVEAITRPTSEEPIPHADEVPFAKYGFRFDDGVPGEVARGVMAQRTRRQDSVLPTLQVICTQLYDRVRDRDDRVIRRSDLEAIGGVAGGMRRHVETLVERTLPGGPGSDRPAFRALVAGLYLRQHDGTLTTALVAEDVLAQRWRGRTPFADLLAATSAGQSRLLQVSTLKIGDGEEGRYVSLGHDALAKVAAAWDEELMRGRRLRKLVAALVGVSAVAAAMLVLAGFAWTQKHSADRQAKAAREETVIAEQETTHAVREAAIADARQLAASAAAVREDFPQRSVLLAHEAFRLVNEGQLPVPEAEQELRTSLATTTGLILDARESPIKGLSFSRDSRRLLTTSINGVRVWDLTAPDPSHAPLVLPDGMALNPAALSPDGLRLATTSDDGCLRVWNLTAPDPTSSPVILRENSPTSNLVFQPDGHRLVSTSFDGTARVWDLSSPDPNSNVQELGQTSAVKALAVSRDGKWLASAGRDGTARVWDLTPGHPVRLITVTREHTGLLTSVAFSPDSLTIATGSQDQTVRLSPVPDPHATAGGIRTTVLRGHREGVTAVAFTPDGRRLVSASFDGTARVWNVSAPDPSVSPVVLHGHEGIVNALAVSPDGRHVLTGSLDMTGRLWDLTRPDPSKAPIVLRGHESGVNAVGISPDGRWLATADLQTTRLRQTAAPDSTSTRLVLRGHTDMINGLSFSPDGRRLATASYDKTVMLWDLDTPGPVKRSTRLATFAENAEVVNFSPDGRRLAAGGSGTARLFDLSAPNPASSVQVLNVGYGDVTNADFSPDGRWLAISNGGHPQVWDMRSAGPENSPRVLTSPAVNSQTISPDSRWLFTWYAVQGTSDRGHLWDLNAADPVKSRIDLPEGVNDLLPGLAPEESVRSARFSPDGHWMALAMSKKSVFLWDVRGLPARLPVAPVVLKGHGYSVNDVAFSPDGRWMATASGDLTARVWDLSAPDPEKACRVFRGHEGAVDRVAFSPDGRRLLTMSSDWTVRLWDLTAADPSRSSVVMQAPKGNGLDDPFAVSPDGHWVASGGRDGEVRLWTLRREDLMEAARASAGRNLQPDEWETYFPGKPYRKFFDDLEIPQPLWAR